MPERESSLLNEDVNPNSKLETIEELREKLRESQKENARLRSSQEILGKRLDAVEAWMENEEEKRFSSDVHFTTFKAFVVNELQPFVDKVAEEYGLTAPKFPHFMNSAGLRQPPVLPTNDPAKGFQSGVHPLIRKGPAPHK